MSSIPATPSHEPEYAWEIATLYPAQGDWSEEEYLELTDHSNRRIEYTEGRLEFLPMPTDIHETLVRFLFRALDRYVNQRKLGEVFSNGIRLRVAAQNTACRMLSSCTETTSTLVTTAPGRGRTW